MRAIFVTLAILFASGCSRESATEAPINTQLTERIDVTGDRLPDTITLFLKAANKRAPVQWLLTIESKGRQIFEYDSDDEEYDALFDDREALPGCPDYSSCKDRYYVHQILEDLVEKEYEPEDLLNPALGSTFARAATGHLSQCCSLVGPPADKILRDLESRIRQKTAIVISVPVSPVMSGPRMVYSADADQLIPIELE